jgi:putative exosortase-associated protein (TIGR04073 family)
MRALIFGLFLAAMACPSWAQTVEAIDDEPPHLGPSETEKAVHNMMTKFGRGLVNCLTFIGELPKQMVLTGRDHGFWVAISLGFLKGLGMMVVRLGAGVFDVAFFLTPWPDDYKPVLEPEYVWE